MNRQRRLGILWSLILLGLAVRLYLAWQPVPTLVARLNADDAYYYLTIAKHIAAGEGVTFDGIAPTNGFHPLYLILLVPLFLVFPGQLELNVHLALTVLMFLNVLTALPLYAFFKRMSPSAGIVGAALWLFNPWVILVGMMGVEAAVYVFLVALTIQLYGEYLATRDRSQLPRLALGLGLAILARSDGVFLLAAIALDMVRRQHSLKPHLILFTIVGSVLMPWLVWNLATLGTILQVSGLAIAYSSHWQLPSGSALIATLLDSSSGMLHTIGLMLLPLGCVLPAVTAGWLLRRRETKDQAMSPGQGAVHLFAPLLYVFLLFVYYAWYLLHQQLWYFLPMLFVLTLCASLLYGRSVVAAQARLAGAMTALLLLITFVVAGWVWQVRGFALYPAQFDGYTIARWLARETDPRARVGAWNAGVLGYFAERTVINLDGVVNNPLYEYVTTRKTTFELENLWEYVQTMHIEYLTDYENIFPQHPSDEFGRQLEMVYVSPSVFFGNEYSVRVFHLTDTR